MRRQELERPRIQGVRFFQAVEDCLIINRPRGHKYEYESRPQRIGDLGEAYMRMLNYGAGSCRLGSGLILDKSGPVRGEASCLDAIGGLLSLDICIRRTPGIPIVCRTEFRGWGYELEAESDVVFLGDERETIGLAEEWKIPGCDKPVSLYIPWAGFAVTARKMEFFFEGKPHIST